MLRSSKDSKLCYGTEQINAAQHLYMLLKKVPQFPSTNDLHEINYDPSLTPKSINDPLHILNTDGCNYVYEFKHEKTEFGYRTTLTEIKLKYNRLSQ